MVVKQITDPNDQDLPAVFSIFRSIFLDSIGDSIDDIRRWLNELQHERRKGTNKLEDYFYISKSELEITGFIYFQYYFHSRFCFVSYYAINKDVPEARRDAARLLLDKFKDILNNGLSECRGIVFEIERPNDELARSENQTRKARKRRLRQSMETIGLTTFELPIDYVQPKLSLRSISGEQSQTLLYCPFRDHVGIQISKEKVMEILQFVYLEIYADAHEGDNENEEYRSYLSGLLQRVRG